MPKLPENFGMEEPVVHPYRALVITVAVIIGVSLFAAGMFYQAVQKPLDLSFDSSETTTQKPSGVTLTEAMRQKLSIDTTVAATSGQKKLESSQLNPLLTTENKPVKNSNVLTNQQLEMLLK